MCGRPQLFYCRTAKTFELRAPPRQFLICVQPQRKISPHLLDSTRPQLFNCRIPTTFGLHSHPRPIAKLSCQSCARRVVCAIASEPKLLCCRATKPPRVCYCAARDLFGMKRRFRSKDLSWAQRQIQPTRGPKTNDSAISPNAAWSACNA